MRWGEEEKSTWVPPPYFPPPPSVIRRANATTRVRNSEERGCWLWRWDAITAEYVRPLRAYISEQRPATVSLGVMRESPLLLLLQ